MVEIRTQVMDYFDDKLTIATMINYQIEPRIKPRLSVTLEFTTPVTTSVTSASKLTL